MSDEAVAPQVLVVDDRDTNLQLIGQALEDAGYVVIAARSGPEALDRAQARRPDLVLLDILMPGMDGRATCRALRDAGLADVPVIFVTGANDGALLVDAFAAGAVDYITKPFLVEELLARVRTHLDLKIARDRLAEMLREREEVTNIIAHDLKNPISAVLFAARMLQTCDDEQRRAALLGDIVAGAEQGLQFIQQFLAGNSHDRLRAYGAQAIDLHEIALLAVRAQRPAAEARGMDVIVRGMAQACADPQVAGSVVQNLLSNAIRYAPERTPVEIEISDTRTGHARLLVMDRGPGIPDAMRGQLFRRYARLLAKPDAPGATHSSGLGLAIAKRDVVQMGGHLWYEPRVGGGAVFGIEFPQQPALAPP